VLQGRWISAFWDAKRHSLIGTMDVKDAT
jgi:hypothetical protein